jgi:hypothetical protein
MEKKQLPHLLCTTNLMLHGIEVPSMIEHRNTLARGWNDWGKQERVDCVITNPPFGGMEDDTVGNDYLLATRETADMFMTLIVAKLLKEDGGRAAVVLPDGFLFGEGIKAKIKEELLDKCHLHTLVRLPNGVFNPYTGIKTNLLFFTRGRPTDTIWFYEHRYPEGVKSYSKTKPLRIEELRPIKDWWGNEADGFADRAESEQAWRVDFKTLKADAIAKAQPHWDQAERLTNQANDLNEQAKALRASIRGEKDAAKRKPVEDQLAELTASMDNLRQRAKDAQAAGDRFYWPIYNLDLKNPNAPEEESHDPDVLLAKYKQLLAEIEQTQNQLRDELAKALEHRVEMEGRIVKVSEFLESFRYVAEAPNGIVQLREMVLHLAMTGALTQRAETDTPAEISYLRNQRHRIELSQKGMLRRQKPLPNVDETSFPWELPATWKWCRLGEVTSYGSTEKAELRDVHPDTWVLELEDIEKGTSRLIEKVRAGSRIFRSSKNKFTAGSVLYGKLRPYLDKVLVADEDGVCTTEVMPIKTFEGVSSHYLRWFLKSPFFKNYATNSTHGMNLPRLGTEPARSALFHSPQRKSNNASSPKSMS